MDSFCFDYFLRRLNEGFASWVEVLGLDHSNPEFQSFDTFVTGKQVFDQSFSKKSQ
jgi:aminopeptidase N